MPSKGETDADIEAKCAVLDNDTNSEESGDEGDDWMDDDEDGNEDDGMMDVDEDNGSDDDEEE